MKRRGWRWPWEAPEDADHAIVEVDREVEDRARRHRVQVRVECRGPDAEDRARRQAIATIRDVWDSSDVRIEPIEPGPS